MFVNGGERGSSSPSSFIAVPEEQTSRTSAIILYMLPSHYRPRYNIKLNGSTIREHTRVTHSRSKPHRPSCRRTQTVSAKRKGRDLGQMPETALAGNAEPPLVPVRLTPQLSCNDQSESCMASNSKNRSAKYFPPTDPVIGRMSRRNQSLCQADLRLGAHQANTIHRWRKEEVRRLLTSRNRTQSSASSVLVKLPSPQPTSLKSHLRDHPVRIAQAKAEPFRNFPNARRIQVLSEVFVIVVEGVDVVHYSDFSCRR